VVDLEVESVVFDKEYSHKLVVVVVAAVAVAVEEQPLLDKVVELVGWNRRYEVRKD
jgi:hypothetical protein